VIIFLSSLMLAGCNTQQAAVPGVLPTSGTTLVTVNGNPISQSVVDALLSQFPPSKVEEIKAQGGLDQIKEQLIVTEALYQEAINAKLHMIPDVKISMSMAQREVLASALVKTKADERITDEKIQSWYDEHLVQFRTSEAEMGMILLKDEEAANTVKGLLDGGADFAETAKAHSLDPRTKDKGGDMGKIETKQLPGQLRASVEAATAGSIIGPMNMMGSWSIIQVRSLNANVTPLEEVKEQIRDSLLREESQAYVEEVRKSATVSEAATAEVSAPAAAKPAEGHDHEGHDHAEKPAAETK
jgi:peptidyl-prolyl cis-trans isomerase C